MLYDQALFLYALAYALAEAAATTGEATFRDLAEETVAYVFERLGAPEGAFYRTRRRKPPNSFRG